MKKFFFLFFLFCFRYRGIDEHNQMVEWFWKVLDMFTNDERIQFLRFVSGRTRIPANPADMSQRFQIISSGRVSVLNLALSLSLSLSLLKQFSTDTQCCIREKNTLILVIFTPALHSPTPLPSTHTHLPTEEGGWVTYFTYIGCCSSHWHQHWHDTFLSWQYLLNQ